MLKKDFTRRRFAESVNLALTARGWRDSGWKE